jgi:predicted MFS family arabinose efflux permease
MGFLDVSSDAWAIEIGKDEELGKINGSMFAGQYAGMAVGSSLLAAIAQFYGYPMSFFVAAIIVILIILFPLVIKETKNRIKQQKMAKLLIKEFKKKQTQVLTVLTPIINLNKGFILIVIPIFMKVILNLDIAQIGLIVALFPITSAFGSIIGGVTSDKWTRKKALSLFVVGSLVFSALMIFADTWIILAVIYAVIGFLQGGYITIKASMLMSVSNPKVGATQFSILMGLGNGGMIVGESISGPLISAFGFTRSFLFSAWFFGPALLVIHFIKEKKQIKNKLAGKSDLDQ